MMETYEVLLIVAFSCLLFVPVIIRVSKKIKIENKFSNKIQEKISKCDLVGSYRIEFSYKVKDSVDPSFFADRPNWSFSQARMSKQRENFDLYDKGFLIRIHKEEFIDIKKISEVRVIDEYKVMIRVRQYPFYYVLSFEREEDKFETLKFFELHLFRTIDRTNKNRIPPKPSDMWNQEVAQEFKRWNWLNLMLLILWILLNHFGGVFDSGKLFLIPSFKKFAT